MFQINDDDDDDDYDDDDDDLTGCRRGQALNCKQLTR